MNVPDWLRKHYRDSSYRALADLAAQQSASILRLHELNFGEDQGIVPTSHDCATNDYHLCAAIAAGEDFRKQHE